ncbi:MAG: hypothetical protein ACOYKZ_03785 [Chlamydiia bacterium]
MSVSLGVRTGSANELGVAEVPVSGAARPAFINPSGAPWHTATSEQMAEKLRLEPDQWEERTQRRLHTLNTPPITNVYSGRQCTLEGLLHDIARETKEALQLADEPLIVAKGSVHHRVIAQSEPQLPDEEIGFGLFVDLDYLVDLRGLDLGSQYRGNWVECLRKVTAAISRAFGVDADLWSLHEKSKLCVFPREYRPDSSDDEGDVYAFFEVPFRDIHGDQAAVQVTLVISSASPRRDFFSRGDDLGLVLHPPQPQVTCVSQERTPEENLLDYLDGVLAIPHPQETRRALFRSVTKILEGWVPIPEGLSAHLASGLDELKALLDLRWALVEALLTRALKDRSRKEGMKLLRQSVADWGAEHRDRSWWPVARTQLIQLFPHLMDETYGERTGLIQDLTDLWNRVHCFASFQSGPQELMALREWMSESPFGQFYMPAAQFGSGPQMGMCRSAEVWQLSSYYFQALLTILAPFLEGRVIRPSNDDRACSWTSWPSPFYKGALGSFPMPMALFTEETLGVLSREIFQKAFPRGGLEPFPEWLALLQVWSGAGNDLARKLLILHQEGSAGTSEAAPTLLERTKAALFESRAGSHPLLRALLQPTEERTPISWSGLEEMLEQVDPQLFQTWLQQVHRLDQAERHQQWTSAETDEGLSCLAQIWWTAHAHCATQQRPSPKHRVLAEMAWLLGVYLLNHTRDPARHQILSLEAGALVVQPHALMRDCWDGLPSEMTALLKREHPTLWSWNLSGRDLQDALRQWTQELIRQRPHDLVSWCRLLTAAAAHSQEAARFCSQMPSLLIEASRSSSEIWPVIQELWTKGLVIDWPAEVLLGLLQQLQGDQGSAALVWTQLSEISPSSGELLRALQHLASLAEQEPLLAERVISAITESAVHGTSDHEAILKESLRGVVSSCMSLLRKSPLGVDGQKQTVREALNLAQRVWMFQGVSEAIVIEVWDLVVQGLLQATHVRTGQWMQLLLNQILLPPEIRPACRWPEPGPAALRPLLRRFAMEDPQEAESSGARREADPIQETAFPTPVGVFHRETKEFSCGTQVIKSRIDALAQRAPMRTNVEPSAQSRLVALTRRILDLDPALFQRWHQVLDSHPLGGAVLREVPHLMIQAICARGRGVTGPLIEAVERHMESWQHLRLPLGELLQLITHLHDCSLMQTEEFKERKQLFRRILARVDYQEFPPGELLAILRKFGEGCDLPLDLSHVLSQAELSPEEALALAESLHWNPSIDPGSSASLCRRLVQAMHHREAQHSDVRGRRDKGPVPPKPGSTEQLKSFFLEQPLWFPYWCEAVERKAAGWEVSTALSKAGKELAQGTVEHAVALCWALEKGFTFKVDASGLASLIDWLLIVTSMHSNSDQDAHIIGGLHERLWNQLKATADDGLFTREQVQRLAPILEKMVSIREEDSFQLAQSILPACQAAGDFPEGVRRRLDQRISEGVLQSYHGEWCCRTLESKILQRSPSELAALFTKWVSIFPHQVTVLRMMSLLKEICLSGRPTLEVEWPVVRSALAGILRHAKPSAQPCKDLPLIIQKLSRHDLGSGLVLFIWGLDLLADSIDSRPQRRGSFDEMLKSLLGSLKAMQPSEAMALAHQVLTMRPPQKLLPWMAHAWVALTLVQRAASNTEDLSDDGLVARPNFPTSGENAGTEGSCNRAPDGLLLEFLEARTTFHGTKATLDEVEVMFEWIQLLDWQEWSQNHPTAVRELFTALVDTMPSHEKILEYFVHLWPVMAPWCSPEAPPELLPTIPLAFLMLSSRETGTKGDPAAMVPCCQATVQRIVSLMLRTGDRAEPYDLAFCRRLVQEMGNESKEQGLMTAFGQTIHLDPHQRRRAEGWLLDDWKTTLSDEGPVDFPVHLTLVLYMAVWDAVELLNSQGIQPSIDPRLLKRWLHLFVWEVGLAPPRSINRSHPRDALNMMLGWLQPLLPSADDQHDLYCIAARWLLEERRAEDLIDSPVLRVMTALIEHDPSLTWLDREAEPLAAPLKIATIRLLSLCPPWESPPLLKALHRHIPWLLETEHEDDARRLYIQTVCIEPELMKADSRLLAWQDALRALMVDCAGEPSAVSETTMFGVAAFLIQDAMAYITGEIPRLSHPGRHFDEKSMAIGVLEPTFPPGVLVRPSNEPKRLGSQALAMAFSHVAQSLPSLKCWVGEGVPLEEARSRALRVLAALIELVLEGRCSTALGPEFVPLDQVRLGLGALQALRTVASPFGFYLDIAETHDDLCCLLEELVLPQPLAASEPNIEQGDMAAVLFDTLFTVFHALANKPAGGPSRAFLKDHASWMRLVAITDNLLDQCPRSGDGLESLFFERLYTASLSLRVFLLKEKAIQQQGRFSPEAVAWFLDDRQRAQIQSWLPKWILRPDAFRALLDYLSCVRQIAIQPGADEQLKTQAGEWAGKIYEELGFVYAQPLSDEDMAWARTALVTHWIAAKPAGSVEDSQFEAELSTGRRAILLEITTLQLLRNNQTIGVHYAIGETLADLIVPTLLSAESAPSQFICSTLVRAQQLAHEGIGAPESHRVEPEESPRIIARRKKGSKSSSEEPVWVTPWAAQYATWVRDIAMLNPSSKKSLQALLNVLSTWTKLVKEGGRISLQVMLPSHPHYQQPDQQGSLKQP